ncbi:MAG TPA: family 16 glycosylhydrolase [Caulobacteraceae bacterium]
MIGGLGDNQYYLSGWGNVIVQGATGVNTVTTWMDYTLPENIQNLYVAGDNLYAAGNSLDNIITVGDNNGQQLYGAAGNNVLVGGAGTDTFIIDGTAGSNAIYNWHAGDQLRLMGGAFTTFAQVQAAMTQQGSDVILHNGQNDVVIRDATISQFQASDFLLSLDHAKLGAATFDDEFNSLSLYNGTSGTWTPHYWYGGVGAYTLTGNGELQLYTAPGFTGTGSTDLGLNPFSVSNGVLDIHAQTVTPDQSAAMWNYGYSSGVITTKDTFAQTYGYFEMRAELPTNVSGAWPAFWLVPADGSWPPELDVMETLTGSSSIDYTTVHSEATGTHTAVGSPNLVTDVGGFHTYGVLWTPTDLTWYLDGQAVFHTATPADMNQPMYMIANMAIGGWAGTPDFTSTDMYVDYIRAYSLSDGSSTWTSSVTPDTPSGADASAPITSGSSSSTSTAPAGPVVSTPTGGSTTTTDGSDVTSTDGSGAVAAAVSTAHSTYNAAAGVTSITLTGALQTVHANDAGDTIVVANNTGNVLFGGAGNDTFVLGRGGDWATGGGGSNTYVFNETPWAAGHIADFNPAHDTVDLTGLLARSGYFGSNPIGDGYIKIVGDAGGNAQIWSDLDQIAHAGWWLVTTLDGVAPSSLAMQGDIVAGAQAGSPQVSGNSHVTASPQVTVSDAAYAAPADVTSITLSGVSQTITGNNLGDIFVSNDSGNILVGGTGNDTFYMGRGGDTATGGGGSDTFAFQATPWASGHITDFAAGDKIDLTGLLSASGYTGADPVGAGYIKIVDDVSGNAQVWSNMDKVVVGYGWYLVTTVDHVAAASLHANGAFITG